MRTGTATRLDLSTRPRLDAKYYLDEGRAAWLLIDRGEWERREVRDVFGEKNIWMPNRFARVPALGPEHGKPILVPYDCFRFRPWSDYFLSRSQVPQYEQVEVTRGWLLMTRSGRNLGPVALVDSFLERFVVSDDMIRVAVAPSEDLFYFAAFMHTAVGQAIIRRDRNGSVIDHLSPKQVAALTIPWPPRSVRRAAAAAFRRAFHVREGARMGLAALRQEFAEVTRSSASDLKVGSLKAVRRFDVKRSDLAGRIDAEPNAPLYRALARRLGNRGGVPLGSLARVHKPPGRYKTLYVDDPQFGVPLLSGRHSAQFRPIAMKHMNPSCWKDPAKYTLTKDTVLLTADGRAEENLADCTLTGAMRDGWAASGHVLRVSPKKGTPSGLLFLACAAWATQRQFKALATGSVVDALSERDVASVVVPWTTGETAKGLNRKVLAHWRAFGRALRSEDEAVQVLQVYLESGGKP